jgi:endonuclease G
MKNLILTFFLFVFFESHSQDTIRITHTNYSTVFSKSKKYPVLVEWWLTKNMVTCSSPLKRKDVFKPDPKLPVETNISKDYVNSGFDRGHMMPAADNLCQTQLISEECFYFSNMAAQYHSLNAGDWKSLEVKTRQLASTEDSIKIWTGNLGEIKKIGTVSVPEKCWKVIFIKKTNTWLAYIFENTKSKPDGIENNQVPITKVTELTGFTFR